MLEAIEVSIEVTRRKRRKGAGGSFILIPY